VANATRLIEQPHAQELSVIEGLIAARGLCRCDEWRHREQKKDRGDLEPRSEQPHRFLPDIAAFFQVAYDRAGSKGSGPPPAKPHV
jgi:hypothetical protein